MLGNQTPQILLTREYYLIKEKLACWKGSLLGTYYDWRLKEDSLVEKDIEKEKKYNSYAFLSQSYRLLFSVQALSLVSPWHTLAHVQSLCLLKLL